MVDGDRLRTLGWAVAAIVAVLLGARLLGANGGQEAAGVTVDPARAGASPAARTDGPGAGDVLVQVAGEVARPGVYRVPAGSRVNDAVARAGGLTRRADQAGINLVARLQDGQQVVVPRRGAQAGGSVAACAAPTAAGGTAAPISLSSATVEQLDTLDGIGPTLAQRIVEFRQQRGGFSSVDQLREVDGIGDKRFAALKEAVTP